MNEVKVVSLAAASKGRQPQLTDDELVSLRAMLEQWQQVASLPGGCPVAHQIIHGRK